MYIYFLKATLYNSIMGAVKRLGEVWEAFHKDSPNGKCIDEKECVKFYNDILHAQITKCYFESRESNLNNKS
tara:strand:+ start:72 stop:287 length:216 start_codon:yes stop_codon:yes gene_type:complete